MKGRMISLLAGAVVVMASPFVTSFALSGLPALAQEGNGAARNGNHSLNEALLSVNQDGKVTVVADSVIGQAPVPLSRVTLTPTNIEAQLTSLMKLLPAGTVWAKLYLPTPLSGRWNGDDVAQYAQAEARLVGHRVGSPEAGATEILGQQVPAEKAREYVAGLHLHLVYLITNPNAQPASHWDQMNQQQRDQYLQQFQNLDFQTRLQMMRQLQQQIEPFGIMMKSIMSGMTDDERIQMKQALGGGK